MAPEVLRLQEYDHSVDVWTVGILAYELHHNIEPFTGDNPAAMNKALVEMKIKWGPELSPQAKDFITYILKIDRKERPSIKEILQHPYLRDSSLTLQGTSLDVGKSSLGSTSNTDSPIKGQRIPQQIQNIQMANFQPIGSLQSAHRDTQAKPTGQTTNLSGGSTTWGKAPYQHSNSIEGIPSNLQGTQNITFQRSHTIQGISSNQVIEQRKEQQAPVASSPTPLPFPIAGQPSQTSTTLVSNVPSKPFAIQEKADIKYQPATNLNYRHEESERRIRKSHSEERLSNDGSKLKAIASRGEQVKIIKENSPSTRFGNETQGMMSFKANESDSTRRLEEINQLLSPKNTFKPAKIETNTYGGSMPLIKYNLRDGGKELSLGLERVQDSKGSPEKKSSEGSLAQSPTKNYSELSQNTTTLRFSNVIGNEQKDFRLQPTPVQYLKPENSGSFDLRPEAKFNQLSQPNTLFEQHRRISAGEITPMKNFQASESLQYKSGNSPSTPIRLESGQANQGTPSKLPLVKPGDRLGAPIQSADLQTIDSYSLKNTSIVTSDKQGTLYVPAIQSKATVGKSNDLNPFTYGNSSFGGLQSNPIKPSNDSAQKTYLNFEQAKPLFKKEENDLQTRTINSTNSKFKASHNEPGYRESGPQPREVTPLNYPSDLNPLRNPPANIPQMHGVFTGETLPKGTPAVGLQDGRLPLQVRPGDQVKPPVLSMGIEAVRLYSKTSAELEGPKSPSQVPNNTGINSLPKKL